MQKNQSLWQTIKSYCSNHPRTILCVFILLYSLVGFFCHYYLITHHHTTNPQEWLDTVIKEYCNKAINTPLPITNAENMLIDANLLVFIISTLALLISIRLTGNYFKRSSKFNGWSSLCLIFIFTATIFSTTHILNGISLMYITITLIFLGFFENNREKKTEEENKE